MSLYCSILLSVLQLNCLATSYAICATFATLGLACLRSTHTHVDVKVHFLRDLVRDGHVKLLKCAGPQNVSDALTKSLPRPAFEKHREFMVGTRVPFSAFYAKATTAIEPIVAYVIKLPIPMYSKKSLVSRADNYSNNFLIIIIG